MDHLQAREEAIQAAREEDRLTGSRLELWVLKDPLGEPLKGASRDVRGLAFP